MDKYVNFRKAINIVLPDRLKPVDFLAVFDCRHRRPDVTEVHEVRKFNKNKFVEDPDHTLQNKRFFWFTP